MIPRYPAFTERADPQKTEVGNWVRWGGCSCHKQPMWLRQRAGHFEKATQIPVVPFLLAAADLTVDWVLGAVQMQKADVSPILAGFAPVQLRQCGRTSEVSLLLNDL